MAKRFAILAAGAALIAAPAAAAEDWRLAASNDETARYVDVGSIERSGATVRYLSEERLPSPETLPGGERYNRLVALTEGDCERMSFRDLRVTLHLDRQFVLQYDSSEVQALKPGTIGYDELDFACSGGAG